MKLIILTGASNTGKSQSLNITFNALSNFGYTRFQNHFRVLGNPIQNDFLDIVERNNHRVGFATMGDYEVNKSHIDDTVQALFRLLQTQQCDVIVMACNSNLAIALAFLQVQNPICIHKQIDNNPNVQLVLNAVDAEIIYKLI
jgi:hypothetical protein